METIWDHNPSAEELAELFIAPLPKAEYMDTLGSQDSEYGVIYRLLIIRGQTDAANGYLAKVKNQQLRFDLELVDVLPQQS